MQVDSCSAAGSFFLVELCGGAALALPEHHHLSSHVVTANSAGFLWVAGQAMIQHLLAYDALFHSPVQSLVHEIHRLQSQPHQ